MTLTNLREGNETMNATQMTRNEIKSAGLAIVGEWGFGSRSAGWIVCDPADRDAVQAAYDAIGEGDLSSDVLDAVKAVGGRYVEEA